MMKSKSARNNDKPRGRDCAIANALTVIGEKYSLLILRESLIFQTTRFDDFVAYIGAPRDVLATRLRHLVEAGLLEKKAYQAKPTRFEYLPTKVARALLPVLINLLTWGEHYTSVENSFTLQHNCGASLQPTISCAACGERVNLTSLRFHQPHKVGSVQ